MREIRAAPSAIEVTDVKAWRLGICHVDIRGSWRDRWNDCLILKFVPNKANTVYLIVGIIIFLNQITFQGKTCVKHILEIVYFSERPIH